MGRAVISWEWSCGVAFLPLHRASVSFWSDPHCSAPPFDESELFGTTPPGKLELGAGAVPNGALDCILSCFLVFSDLHCREPGSIKASTTRHGWYDIVCGIVIARRHGLVLVGNHVANITFDQSESYPLTRKWAMGKRESHHCCSKLLPWLKKIYN